MRRRWVGEGASGAIAIGAMAVGLAGCSAGQFAATGGGSIDPADAAWVQVIEYRQSGAVWNAVVKEVDGKRPPYLFRETQETRTSLFGGSTAAGKAIELDPGQHSLRVGIYWNEFPSNSRGNPFNGHCTLFFEAEPGGRYELQADYWRGSTDGFSFPSREWEASIVDTATQRVVSSQCNPEDF